MHVIPFQFQKSNKGNVCEDAEPYTSKKWSIVCDGLGGSGATKHNVEIDGEKLVRTSGYLGSRLAAEAVNNCFKRYEQSGFIDQRLFVGSTSGKEEKAKNLCAAVREEVYAAFNEAFSRWNLQKLRGKTLKIFPTTLVAAIYHKNYKNTYDVLVIWAGDSRAYFMSAADGLQMLTLDDARQAMVAMNSSSEMYNCLAYGFPFTINYAFHEIKEPGILFCCSDGCFDYMRSPLHLDWLLTHVLSGKLNTEVEKQEDEQDTAADSSTEEDGASLIGFEAEAGEGDPEAQDESVGDELDIENSDEVISYTVAEAIRDNLYQTIGDDTTMAGIIVGFHSLKEISDEFAKHVEEIDQHAIAMNNQMNIAKQCAEENSNLNMQIQNAERGFLSGANQDQIDRLKESADINRKKMAEALEMVDQIWNEYKIKYQRVLEAEERGNV